MFCHQCGKELHENARFCLNCGALIRKASEQPGSADTKETDPQPADSSADQKEPNPQPADFSAGPEELNPQPADFSAGPEETAPPEMPDVDTPADLILKRGKVTVTGNELHLYKNHYIRKTGKKKFKKEKAASIIPFDTILGTSIEHYKCGGRIFLSLLLLICFAAGFLFSVHYGYGAYGELNTPYRDKELAALESIMTVIDNDGAGQLLQYQNAQRENRADAEALSAKLSELKAQQTGEILTAIYSNDRFDLDDFFNRDLFSRAYQDYLQDLLNAFKTDELLDSWLYSYYKTTKEYGGNDFLDTDMWIYNSSGENKFSSGLDSAASLMNEQYDLDLYEHILYTGRIYITGADFLREILSLPRYIVDGAVFSKAFGGVPNAAEMSVPGWNQSHYEEFWLYGVDYYGAASPMWLDRGFQAKNFVLDWNTLLDEAAYYNAYQKFMDKIAPNLPCYEMAAYHADDMAYGGMSCDLRGTEASFIDIIAVYAENHPEFIDELMKNKRYSKVLTTSVDKDIAEAEARLEKLEDELLELQEQEKELASILAYADIYRGNYMFLLTEMEQRTQKLTSFLRFVSGAALLCASAVLICLYKLFGFLKRPRHLFIICGQDMEYAFNTRHYPKEQITALQSRLPPGVPTSLNQVNASDANSDKLSGES